MSSLQIKSILALLTKEKQIDLYNELANELESYDDGLQNVYIVSVTGNYPTGGDWCSHDALSMITGNYSEAKTRYDKLTCLEVIECGMYIVTYHLMKGNVILEQTTYDYVHETVTRKKYVDDKYENYELKYPLYHIVFEHHYDTVSSIGIYDNLENAKSKFNIMQIKETANYAKSGYPEGFKLKIFVINDKMKSDILLEYIHHPLFEMVNGNLDIE